MNLCIVAQIYLAMAQTHMDLATNHVRIAEVGKFLNRECQKLNNVQLKKDYEKLMEKEKKEQKVDQTKVE